MNVPTKSELTEKFFTLGLCSFKYNQEVVYYAMVNNTKILGIKNMFWRFSGFGLLIMVLIVEVVLADDWSPWNRDKALAALDSSYAQERRKGLGRLAEIGQHRDVPHMLKLLWDDDFFVRGMAEQSIWGLWMRANDPLVDPLFQTAIEYISHDKIKEGIDALNRVILAKPEFAEAWSRLGDAYMHLGDYEQALRNYQQALEFNQYHFGVMESCASIWLERQDLRKAAVWFRQALAINPNLVASGITLRQIEEELGADDI